MSHPMMSFGNEELDQMPLLKKGDVIQCQKCGGEHTTECGKDKDGKESSAILFYTCRGTAYIAGVGGRSVMSMLTPEGRAKRKARAEQLQRNTLN